MPWTACWQPAIRVSPASPLQPSALSERTLRLRPGFRTDFLQAEGLGAAANTATADGLAERETGDWSCGPAKRSSLTPAPPLPFQRAGAPWGPKLSPLSPSTPPVRHGDDLIVSHLSAWSRPLALHGGARSQAERSAAPAGTITRTPIADGSGIAERSLRRSNITPPRGMATASAFTQGIAVSAPHHSLRSQEDAVRKLLLGVHVPTNPLLHH